MSVNINFKTVIFVSCILLLTHETFAQKTIDPAKTTCEILGFALKTFARTRAFS